MASGGAPTGQHSVRTWLGSPEQRMGPWGAAVGTECCDTRAHHLLGTHSRWAGSRKSPYVAGPSLPDVRVWCGGRLEIHGGSEGLLKKSSDSKILSWEVIKGCL